MKGIKMLFILNPQGKSEAGTFPQISLCRRGTAPQRFLPSEFGPPAFPGVRVQATRGGVSSVAPPPVLSLLHLGSPKAAEIARPRAAPSPHGPRTAPGTVTKAASRAVAPRAVLVDFLFLVSLPVLPVVHLYVDFSDFVWE